jgi:hypothetical protein
VNGGDKNKTKSELVFCCRFEDNVVGQLQLVACKRTDSHLTCLLF